MDVVHEVFSLFGQNKNNLGSSKVLKSYNHSLIEKCYSKIVENYEQKKK